MNFHFPSLFQKRRVDDQRTYNVFLKSICTIFLQNREIIAIFKIVLFWYPCFLVYVFFITTVLTSSAFSINALFSVSFSHIEKAIFFFFFLAQLQHVVSLGNKKNCFYNKTSWVNCNYSLETAIKHSGMPYVMTIHRLLSYQNEHNFLFILCIWICSKEILKWVCINRVLTTQLPMNEIWRVKPSHFFIPSKIMYQSALHKRQLYPWKWYYKGRFTHSMLCPCRAAKGLECVLPVWFTQCGRVWFTLAMPRPCPALTMTFFSRPRHSTAIERRPVGYLATFSFFWLPRGVPRRLLSEAYQSFSQWSIHTTLKSGSSTLQKRWSVKLLD